MQKPFKADHSTTQAAGQAPEVEHIRFEDEHETESESVEFELRCRKCR